MLHRLLGIALLMALAAAPGSAFGKSALGGLAENPAERLFGGTSFLAEWALRNGVVLGKSAPSPLVAADRLVALSTPTETASYAYDWDGLRKSKTVNGQTTEYIWSLGKLEAEIPPGGNAFRYLHGPGGPLGVTGPGGGSTFLRDGLGSVVGRVSGGAAQANPMNPWGAYVGAVPGPGESASGFTGHHNDVESGLVYAQQRYMDPALGRFLSEDPVHGDLTMPLSTQGFTYANANPTKYTDPDGRLFAEVATITANAAFEAFLQLSAWRSGRSVEHELGLIKADLSALASLAGEAAAAAIGGRSGSAAGAGVVTVLVTAIGVTTLASTAIHTDDISKSIASIPERFAGGVSEAWNASDAETRARGSAKAVGAASEAFLLVEGAVSVGRGGATAVEDIAARGTDVRPPILLMSREARGDYLTTRARENAEWELMKSKEVGGPRPSTSTYGVSMLTGDEYSSLSGRPHPAPAPELGPVPNPSLESWEVMNCSGVKCVNEMLNRERGYGVRKPDIEWSEVYVAPPHRPALPCKNCEVTTTGTRQVAKEQPGAQLPGAHKRKGP